MILIMQYIYQHLSTLYYIQIIINSYNIYHPNLLFNKYGKTVQHSLNSFAIFTYHYSKFLHYNNLIFKTSVPYPKLCTEELQPNTQF